MAPLLSLWDFSLRFYADQKTGQLCLELQDGFSADVNVLLFLLWSGYRRRQLSFEDLGLVIEAVADWRKDVVTPLRGVRRALKQINNTLQSDEVAALRNAVKSQELEAERLQQSMMEARFSGLGTHTADIRPAAATNLSLYVDFLGCSFSDGQAGLLLSRLEAVS